MIPGRNSDINEYSNPWMPFWCDIDFLNDRRQRGFAYAQLCCCDIDVQKVDVGVVVTEKNEKYSRKNTDTKNTKLT